MKIIYSMVSIILCTAASVYPQQNIVTRATRPDAVSYSGSVPQIVSRECAQLAQIKQCVCNLNNLLQACCSSLDMQINGIASSLENDLENIIDLLGGISNLDLPISHFETLFSLVESLNISLIETLIETILGLDSSFDHVSSLIEYDIAIDEETLAHVPKIETQIETVVSLVDLLVDQNCASANDALASNLDDINSSIELAIVLATQTLDIDQTIASKMVKIDTQLDMVNSLIDFAMLDCESRSDVIINEVQLLQDQEASCCAELSSEIEALQIDIESRFDVIESSLEGIINVEELVSQLSVLVSVIDNFDTDLIVSLIDTTESGFDVVTSQLDSLSACGSMPISSATTITVPGNYCLDQDITGNITIASSDVTLNLNERMIFGSVIINTGLSNVIVTNGFINAGISNAVVMNGTFDNISLIALHIVRASNGVLALGGAVTNMYISYTIAENCINDGYNMQQCSGNIINCAAYSNGNDGFNLSNNGISLSIQNSQATGNGNNGFSAVGANTATRYTITSCTAYENTSNGFILEGCNMYVVDCVAINNGTGSLTGIAVNNGFCINNVGGPATVAGTVSDCVSIKNGFGGFNWLQYTQGVSTLNFIGNYAADNYAAPDGTIENYIVNSAISVFANKPPYYWLSWNNAGAGRRVNISGN